MNNETASELLALCASMVADGELSIHEAHDLADWLNHHPTACDEWPGNLLVTPLQEAWADGKLGKMELRKIATVITRILRENARKEREQIKLGAATLLRDKIEAAAASFDPTRPQTPALDIQVEVPAETDRRVAYTVNLAGPSCTCPDWVANRAQEPHRALTRCCKHVLKAFIKMRPENYWPDWFQGFCAYSLPLRPGCRSFVVTVRGRLVLLSESRPPWWNVISAEGEDALDRYGFNIEEQRWAYENEPDHEADIRRWINHLV